MAEIKKISSLIFFWLPSAVNQNKIEFRDEQSFMMTKTHMFLVFMELQNDKIHQLGPIKAKILSEGTHCNKKSLMTQTADPHLSSGICWRTFLISSL